MGAQLLATGHGKAVRTAAVPARAGLDCTRVRSTPAPAGVPGSAGEYACLLQTGGQPGMCGTPEEQLGKPSDDTFTLDKYGWGRRRFAPAQPGCENSGFVGRRDEYAADTRPRRVRSSEGKAQLPPAL